MSWSILLIIGYLWLSVPLMAASFTENDLKQHNNEMSCWVVIEGKVYDLTEYIDKHPKKGRKELIETCGKDGTLGWKLKGEKQKPHSEKAKQALRKYEIGQFK